MTYSAPAIRIQLSSQYHLNPVNLADFAFSVRPHERKTQRAIQLLHNSNFISAQSKLSPFVALHATLGATMSAPSPIVPANPASKKRRNSNPGGSDAIKVICRFRPPRAPAKEPIKSGKNTYNPDSFKLNEETGDVNFCSDYQDGKHFAFDKVSGTGTFNGHLPASPFSFIVNFRYLGQTPRKPKSSVKSVEL
jgi:hypothetical protein